MIITILALMVFSMQAQIAEWKYQNNRDKFWTIDFDYLQNQLETSNHTRLQAFDENGKRVTNNGSITFPVSWNLSQLDFTQKNVAQTLTGTVIVPEGINYSEAPTIEVWFMQYVPKAGQEPWIVTPIELPEKPLTVIYQEKFLSAQEWIIEGEAGFRVIHLPHTRPVWFKQSSTIAEGVEVIVDNTQRVIQIDTDPFEGKKELCRLKISGTSPWGEPKFSYIYPYNSTGRGFTVDVYEIKENDVPILFVNKGKVQTFPLDVWEQAKEDYINNNYEWLEKTQILPPLQIVYDEPLPDDALVSIQPRLMKVPLGREWNDVEYPNPDPDSPYPTLVKPGVKRSFEGLASRVLFVMKNGEQVENIMAATPGNYNPNEPGIYQPEISVSIPDVPNPLGLIHKVWIIVQNEDGTDPPGVDEFYNVKWFETMQLTVPIHYPETLLKGHFHGINYPSFAGFAQRGHFVTDYSRNAHKISWENAEFPTNEAGILEIEGQWEPRYNFVEPDILANPPKVYLHVVDPDAQLPIIVEGDPPVVVPEEPTSILININSASLEELQEITGVGPVLAKRIYDARPFTGAKDLTRVRGIGAKTALDIGEQVTFK